MFLDKSQFDLNAPAEPEHPEQTGPKRFLEIIQAEFLNLVKLNLLLLLCCLPVVALPPALFAVHCLIRRMVLGKPVSCWQDYWGAFRSGWKRAYGAFCLTALPMGLAGDGASWPTEDRSKPPSAPPWCWGWPGPCGARWEPCAGTGSPPWASWPFPSAGSIWSSSASPSPSCWAASTSGRCWGRFAGPDRVLPPGRTRLEPPQRLLG